MGVRFIEIGETAVSKLRAANMTASTKFGTSIMESFDSLRLFTSKCQAYLQHIDVTILNAGLSPVDLSRVPATSHERTIQVNYLGAVLLTVLLLPNLRAKESKITTERLQYIMLPPMDR